MLNEQNKHNEHECLESFADHGVVAVFTPLNNNITPEVVMLELQNMKVLLKNMMENHEVNDNNLLIYLDVWFFFFS